MKKKLALALAVAMALSMTACGQGDTSVGGISVDSASSAQSSVQGDQSQPQDEQTAKPVIYTLDTVPAPVMTGTIGSDKFSEDENMVTYIARYGVEHDVGVSELEAYLATLKDAGFVLDVSRNNVTEKSYEYSAFATNSNATVVIEFEWHQYNPSGEHTISETAVFQVDVYIEEADVKADLTGVNAEELLPPLPEGNWSSSEFDNGRVRWTHFYLAYPDEDTIRSYAEQLKSAGYALELEEAPSGNEDANLYYFEAENEDGVVVRVKIVSEEGDTMATVSIGIPN